MKLLSGDKKYVLCSPLGRAHGGRRRNAAWECGITVVKFLIYMYCLCKERSQWSQRCKIHFTSNNMCLWSVSELPWCEKSAYFSIFACSSFQNTCAKTHRSRNQDFVMSHRGLIPRWYLSPLSDIPPSHVFAPPSETTLLLPCFCPLQNTWKVFSSKIKPSVFAAGCKQRVKYTVPFFGVGSYN